ncbi:MAG: 16S rRNA (cytosine(1402)-N(4))-methyltransferase RsmH [Clostridia bacterium]|nr:16S rRNA (cytosine(1402)-N(4))-methyltransferase RsmH [Clostridia bacterium]MDD7483462.1 16S rRNA (cytosine(1402)-N(4))-methyltransferase RsmH [Clostridia bacterium]MDY5559236.1 16S rRNA (cytosine(1402)-N(4))-methyltransferase RsmH [Candidatus Heritagella sp.]
METAFYHKPVLFRETIASLSIRPDGLYIDGTAGGGGHSEAILQKLTSGRLLSIDQDPDAIAVCRRRFAPYGERSQLWQGNFGDMQSIAAQTGFLPCDGVLMDIGVSSHQLDTPQRGFSYHAQAPLDMRMSQSGPTAADLLASLPEKEIARILWEYGEEKAAGRIARAIVQQRESTPITTTLQLADLVRESVPAAVRRGPGHPARKTFQALRIAVNGELDRLNEGLDAAFSVLRTGGILSVITFHSLEDRMVKQRMASWCEGCTCPPEFPVCVCGKKPRAELLYKKGLSASEEELQENPRARSARLRVCRKLCAGPPENGDQSRAE